RRADVSALVRRRRNDRGRNAARHVRGAPRSPEARHRMRVRAFVGLVLVASAFAADGTAAPRREVREARDAREARDGRDSHEVRARDVVNPAPVQQAPSSPALALAALDRRIADLDAEEDTSKRELAELGAKIAEAHGRALGRGRTFYRVTRAG